MKRALGQLCRRRRFGRLVVPVVLGAGRTMFERVEKKLELALQKTRPFKNGNVVLWYEPR